MPRIAKKRVVAGWASLRLSVNKCAMAGSFSICKSEPWVIAGSWENVSIVQVRNNFVKLQKRKLTHPAKTCFSKCKKKTPHYSGALIIKTGNLVFLLLNDQAAGFHH